MKSTTRPVGSSKMPLRGDYQILELCESDLHNHVLALPVLVFFFNPDPDDMLLIICHLHFWTDNPRVVNDLFSHSRLEFKKEKIVARAHDNHMGSSVFIPRVQVIITPWLRPPMKTLAASLWDQTGKRKKADRASFRATEKQILSWISGMSLL